MLSSPVSTHGTNNRRNFNSEHRVHFTGSSRAGEKWDSSVKEMVEYYSPALLKLAANNDLSGFKQAVEEGGSSVNKTGLWCH